MNKQWLRFLGVGVTLVGLPILCMVGLIILNDPWQFRPPPPTPPQAMQLEATLLRDYTSVADGTQRETQFVIDQPEATVRAFYRTELTKQGWIYQGAVRPKCGSSVLKPVNVVDVYDRGGRTLIVRIGTRDARRSRPVHVVEYQSAVTYPIQRTPMPNASVHDALIGDWQAIDESASRTFMLCWYEHGAVSVFVAGINGLTGTYQWVDEGIRVMVNTSQIVDSTDPRRDDDDGRCRDLPALLSSGCQAKLVNPADYPGPDGGIRPPSATESTPDRAPYPPPRLPVTEHIHIDGVFAISIEGHTLTLTNRSGVVTSFRRVTE